MNELLNTPLSERELEILGLVAQGKSNKEIASELFISINTVKVHLAKIFQRIGVASRTEATLYAIEHGFVQTNLYNSLSKKESSLLPEVEEVEYVAKRLESIAFGNNYFLITFFALTLILILGIVFPKNLLLLNPQYSESNVDQISEKLAPIPSSRSYASIVEADGNIYLIGGESDSKVVATTNRYSYKTNRWEQLKDKTTAVSETSAIRIGDRIFIPGGKIIDDTRTTIFESYDLVSNIWTTHANLPHPLSAQSLIVLNGMIYMFGGWDGITYFDDIYSYVIDKNTWDFIGKMREKRAFANTFTLQDKICLVGGKNDSGKIFDIDCVDVVSLDGEKSGWHQISKIDLELESESLINSNGFIFMIGRKNNGNSFLYQYLPQEATWRQIDITSSYVYHDGHGAVMLEDYIYLFGGKLKGENTSDAYRFKVLYTTVVPLIIK